jgi:hypothetical protein
MLPSVSHVPTAGWFSFSSCLTGLARMGMLGKIGNLDDGSYTAGAG